MKKFAILAIAVLFVACCPCRNALLSNKPLVGTTWGLIQMEGRSIDPADAATILFAQDGRFSGDVAGDYRYNDDGVLHITAPKGGSAKLTGLLSSIDHYKMDGSVMMLFSNGEMVLAFEAKQ